MSCARVVAQAKLNLGLRILAREASGFHTLETVFARLELGDEITVRTGGSGRSIDCVAAPDADPGICNTVGPPDANLAYRAALAYAENTGWPDSFAIEVEKAIPVGGGLGGGSADAGAVLRALNALAPRPVPDGDLLRLAAALGSDVPFLTTTAPLALAWGRGERMLALPALPARTVVLVLPDFGVSTRDAYAWLAAARSTSAARAPAATAATTPSLASVEQLGTWETLQSFTGNDFEPIVAERHPEVPAVVEALRGAGARIAHMTGSGSTVYGIFASPPDLASLARTVRGRIVLTRTAERVGDVRGEV